MKNVRGNVFPNLINRMRLKTMVEIGVNRGQFAEHILKRTKLDKYYCVDIWENEEIYQEALERLKPFKNCVIIKEPSMEAVKRFKNNSLGLVYIDASHRFSDVYDDMIYWGRKVKINNIISGHDYSAKFLSQVKPVVDYYCKKYVYDLHVTSERVYKSWWFKKIH